MNGRAVIVASLIGLAPFHVLAGHGGSMTFEELQGLKSRILVVELPSLREWMDGCGPYADTLVGSRAHVTYLEAIEAAVRNCWTFNPQIEFKSRTECMALFAQGSTEHVVMMKVQQTSSGGMVGHFNGGLDKLAFYRTDRPLIHDKKGNVDLRVRLFETYLSGRFSAMRTVNYEELGLCFTLEQLQRCLEWCLANKKVIGFGDFVKLEVSKNCGLLKGRLLYALDDKAPRDIREQLIIAYGGDLRFVDYDELMGLYSSSPDGVALLMTIPAGRAMEGPDWFYGKVIVDPATSQILGAAGFGVTTLFHLEYSKAMMERLTECK